VLTSADDNPTVEAIMHRAQVSFMIGCAVRACILLGTPQSYAQDNDLPPISVKTMPSDIDPKSGFRLPLPHREDLDEAGKRAYDRGNAPGATLAGLQGPAGVQLYSTKTAPHLTALNRYLRFEAGIDPRIREIAILVTAREMDSQFEWVAHEAQALKDGVPQNVIDVIKYRRDTDSLADPDATVIQLGRQIWRDHRVTSATFAKAKALFGPNKLIDLVLLMGNYAGTAALLTAVDMQLHAGAKPLLPVP
jgi:4-carboxymuconolactone decarboxylase